MPNMVKCPKCNGQGKLMKRLGGAQKKLLRGSGTHREETCPYCSGYQMVTEERAASYIAQYGEHRPAADRTPPIQLESVQRTFTLGADGVLRAAGATFSFLLRPLTRKERRAEKSKKARRRLERDRKKNNGNKK